MGIGEKFLEALGASVKKEAVAWTELSEKEWRQLFRLASKQQVLPLIYEAVCQCPAAKSEPELLETCRKKVFKEVARQVKRTKNFLDVYQKICAKGVFPLVMKGMICRNLYPHPDSRPSLDEDILILEEQFQTVHQILAEEGMRLSKPDEKPDEAYEVSYKKEGSYLYIELHKHLFPKDSEAYGEFNRFFEGVHERAISETIQGVPVYTLNYTDHLLYLICHAIKHFLHSGVGVRQVCDIAIFANAYGRQIDWDAVFLNCKDVHAEKLVAAMFRIGEKYLGFDAEKACYPAKWRAIETDETALLRDMLEGGITGNSGKSRLHSSTITLNAVSEYKKGKQAKPVWVKSIFPPASHLTGKYQYLEKYPFLLPVAWADRIVKYGKEIRKSPTNQPGKSIEIANQRIGLLKEYGIIED